MKLFAIFIVIITLASCTSGSPCIIKLPTPQDRPQAPSAVPDYIPIYSPSEDEPTDPLRMVNEKLGNSDAIRTVLGTRITNAQTKRVYEWFRQEFLDRQWEMLYDLPYDEKSLAARLTCQKDELVLSIEINLDPIRNFTIISYIGTMATYDKEEK